jgi:hypothetical protein
MNSATKIHIKTFSVETKAANQIFPTFLKIIKSMKSSLKKSSNAETKTSWTNTSASI